MGTAAPRSLVLLAFLAVYVIWGSTYLAILFAIESLPPFLMAGIRFLVAGLLLHILMRSRGEPPPTRIHWIGAAIVGALLLGVGNGGVTWAEQRIPSGIAALLAAGTPAWMVLFDWLRPGGSRPRPGVAVGLVLGVAGIVLLVGPGEVAGGGGIDLLGAGVVLLASMCWALGSIASRHLALPRSAMLLTSMEMIVAGVLLTLLGTFAGEWRTTDWSGVTRESVMALGYLIVFGSWIGFGAYVWLLRVSSPARVSTYAYVNPAVAVVLGWALADERLDSRMIVAMAVIVCGVAMITLFSGNGATVKPASAGDDAGVLA